MFSYFSACPRVFFCGVSPTDLEGGHYLHTGLQVRIKTLDTLHSCTWYVGVFFFVSVWRAQIRVGSGIRVLCPAAVIQSVSGRDFGTCSTLLSVDWSNIKYLVTLFSGCLIGQKHLPWYIYHIIRMFAPCTNPRKGTAAAVLEGSISLSM